MTTRLHGAHAADQPVVPSTSSAAPAGPRDVQIDIAYCGICHSDLHGALRNGWARNPACPATRSSAT